MELDLTETVALLREELARAVVAGAGGEYQFPVEGAQLEFHVGLRKEGRADAKLKAWVVEAGGSGALSREEIHKVTVTLGALVNRFGETVKIAESFDDKP